MEVMVVCDFGVVIMVCCGGIIDQVDVQWIVIWVIEDLEGGDVGVDIYCLCKFKCLNQFLIINQCLLVKVGDWVVCGQVVVDGLLIDQGELVIGWNVVVVFMLWNGYNYEDLIFVSECIYCDDVYILIYIDEYEVVVCDIKLGFEEIICDILNVGEEVLCNFDEVGIVYIGVEVGLGDILVGKIILKGELLMMFEEKLLCVIFGEKVFDVCDILLCLLLGVYGIIVEVCVFNCYGVDKDECVLQIECEEVECLVCDWDDELVIFECNIYVCLKLLIIGKEVVKGLKGIKVGVFVDDDLLSQLLCGQWWQFVVVEEDIVKEVEVLNQ